MAFPRIAIDLLQKQSGAAPLKVCSAPPRFMSAWSNKHKLKMPGQCRRMQETDASEMGGFGMASDGDACVRRCECNGQPLNSAAQQRRFNHPRTVSLWVVQAETRDHCPPRHPEPPGPVEKPHPKLGPVLISYACSTTTAPRSSALAQDEGTHPV